MSLEWTSPCKVNFLLNILGKRPDGFHELETVLHPVGICDRIEFTRGGDRIALTCNHPTLPVDQSNLVVRAAQLFRQASGIADGVRIHLEKQIPLAAGLGGGSANAAAALRGLNALFGGPLSDGRLSELAAQLGSDVPFFLQPLPAVATGRGERIQPLDWFGALAGTWLLLVHPGFGISTAWAYQSLARYPQAIHGQPGRAARLVARLQTGQLTNAAADFYNALELPAFEKYPILALYQEFLRAEGAAVVLMSGSGSSIFALAPSEPAALTLRDRFLARFGTNGWTAVSPVGAGQLSGRDARKEGRGAD
jgi:4-diphosphocytidyl-2-C-methyl-D-erythritol kinase